MTVTRTVKDWRDAASLIKAAHADADADAMARILVTGPVGCGKTRACTDACAGSPTLWWDISSGPATMVGSTGLSRYFQTKSETIIIDDVDSSLAIEGNARGPGVSALLSIITDPLKKVVILVSTSDDPFKCLGTSSAGKTIRSSITTRVHIDSDGGDNKTTVAALKERSKNMHMQDTLYVLMLEAAAGYHSNDALLKVAYDMRRLLLTE